MKAGGLSMVNACLLQSALLIQINASLITNAPLNDLYYTETRSRTICPLIFCLVFNIESFSDREQVRILDPSRGDPRQLRLHWPQVRCRPLFPSRFGLIST